MKVLEGGVLPLTSWLTLEEKRNTTRVVIVLGVFTRRCGGFGPGVEILRAKIPEFIGAFEPENGKQRE